MRQRLRHLARRLPITSAYERRIAALRTEIAHYRVDGEFVAPGHFYSAIPNREELEGRRVEVFDRDPTDIPGVDLRMDAQWALLDELAPNVAEMPFGDSPTDELRYGFANDAFSYADGMFLHLMLRQLRPARVIEVGSGHSSACTLDTVGEFLGGAPRCTFVEPYDRLLRSMLRRGDLERVEILTTPVQSVPLARFAELEANDLLFIDSTHVAKAGSDVNYLLFDVLPVLSPGVYVHLHDVFPGFEYPWAWVEQGRAWNEDYMLRAFLQFNDSFEIVLWPNLLAATDSARIAANFPLVMKNRGGSIYLRRRLPKLV
jgi:Methyltransferase domain